MKKLIAAMLFVPMLAHANGFVSGNDLLRRMDSQETFDRLYALGFVLGVHDTLGGEVICAPQGATAGQLRDVVRKHLTNNPETRDLGAATIVMVSLAVTYPCSKKPKGKQL
jgi:hypothetical protein